MAPALEVVGRGSEIGSVYEFLDAVPAGASALLLDGEIGIGKTTLWREGVAAAEQRHQRVLS
jgi:tRNA A37 threonylcarbamoyladenosine biosynthesis protein TsaE